MDDGLLSPPLSTTPQPLVTHQQDIPETVIELRHLTAALSAFYRRYDDLQSHFNFISSSIDSLLNPHSQTLTSISDQTLILEQPIVSPSEKSPISTREETLLSKNHISSDQTLILEKSQSSHPWETLISEKFQNTPPKETLILEKTQIDEQTLLSAKSSISPLEETPISEKSLISNPGETQIPPPKKTLVSEKALISEQSEIVTLCKSMKGNRLRKYLLSRLSEPEKLLEEIPLALKQCPNPSKLVLDCIGQFYLLSTKYDKKTQSLNPYRTLAMNPSRTLAMNRSRIITVIILECFLITRCDVSESEIKGLSETAIAWRKRIVNEDGIGEASEIDAKGLLLFIGCFGIPNDFTDDEVLNLIRVSNGNGFLVLLRKSKILMEKMREIIEAKQKETKEVEALDIAFTFGPEINYSPKRILGNFLKNSRKSWDAAWKLVHDSELNQAIILFKNQLSDLKSLEKCIEKHKVNPSDLISNWHPNKRMGHIERELIELENKLEKENKQNVVTKRKADQFEPLKKLNEKKVKEAHLSLGLEEQKVPIFFNKSPPRVDNGVVFSRPYQIEESLVNERFVCRGRSGPERYISPSRIGPERFISPSRIGPERYLGPSRIGPERYLSSNGIERERFLGSSGIVPERFVGPSGVGPEGLMGRSYGDLYTRYLKPPPSVVSGSKRTDLYGFTDAVIEAEAAFTHRPRHRY